MLALGGGEVPEAGASRLASILASLRVTIEGGELARRHIHPL
jgi:hypothetical protein